MTKDARLRERLVAIQTKMLNQHEEIERLRAELAATRDDLQRARYAPLGDNHHNAAACPTCSPKLASAPSAPTEAEAEIERLKEELAHERHEKETVFDANTALIKYLRAERDALKAASAPQPEDVEIIADIVVKDGRVEVRPPSASQEEPTICKARAAGKTDPPQDCDWPFCGCDTHADKVIAHLQECGMLREKVAQEEPTQAHSAELIGLLRGAIDATIREHGNEVFLGDGYAPDATLIEKVLEALSSSAPADPIAAAVDAQIDPLKRELVDVGHRLAKETQ